MSAQQIGKLRGSFQIIAFISLTEQIALGGQPTAEELAHLAAAGCQTVINLGLHDTEYALEDEAAVVSELRMVYHHIPVEFERPELSQIYRFFDVMDASAATATFVHCAANYRVSCFASLYMRSRHGWTQSQASRLIESVWEPNRVWATFLDEAAQELRLVA